MSNLIRIAYLLESSLRRLYWSKEKLVKYQEKRLKAVVKYAYESVPFYHEKFRRAGVSPSEIRSLGDLSKLPITRKNELREISTSMCVSREYSIAELKTLRTSGSTGTPFISYVSPAEDDLRKAIYLRANISCGQRPRDSWVFITAPHNFAGTTRIQRILGIYAQKCISVFNKINEQVRLSQQWKADVLDGYSGALLLLAKEVERRGVKDIRPRLMFGSADLIDAPTRRYLEEVFKAPYHDQYGCSEVNRTAWQCPERTGYHMDVDSVITQFVDDEGHDVSEGETGEIVHTSLFNFAMPFIRYSIRDRGRPSSETCPCGRVFPLMEVVEGRRDSFISLPDGRIMSPRAFTVAMRMFEYYDNIEWFRIVQKKPNVFEVYLKPKKSLNEELIKAKLESHFAKVLDLPDIEVNVELSDDIPLSKGGKLMAVVSEVEPKN